MELNNLWFVLISVLFIGFFFLEGFDYGSMVLLPILGKTEKDRRMMINAIGPFWDGNEVWLLTAGGAIFAAFPNWYATMFSGFYLALFLILVALIFRGVAFEFRNKIDSDKWRSGWDLALILGSLVPALLFGVALANLLKGVPIDGSMEYVGGFFDLLSVFTLTAGISALSFFLYHGAIFISLKTSGDLAERSGKLAFQLGIVASALWAIVMILAFTTLEKDIPLFAAVLGILSFLATGASIAFTKAKSYGKSFILNGLAIATAVGSLFAAMFPFVMVSSLNPEFSMTIAKASSSPYTLKIMTFVALTVVPIVLAYQAWTYWIFRKRVTGDKLEY